MGSVAEIPFGIDSARHLVRREPLRHATPPDRAMLAGAAASLHHPGRELRDEIRLKLAVDGVELHDVLAVMRRGALTMQDAIKFS